MDVLVKVDKFIFPTYFIVLDMEEDKEIPDSCNSRGAGINNIYNLNSSYCCSIATAV